VRKYIHVHHKRVVIGAIAFAILVVAAVALLFYLSSYESTDDAEVDGHLNPISARVVGTVIGVYAENDQAVRAGQLLVDLDPRDYTVALDQAKASVTQAQAALRAESPNVPIVITTNQTSISSSQANVASAEAALLAAQQDYQARLADVRQAEANNIKAQKDVARYAPLVERSEISRQQFDAVVATANSQQARLESAQDSAQASQKSVEENRQRLLQAETRQAEVNTNAPRSTAIRKAQLATREAALVSAQSQQEQAELNMSYTKIYAPVSGVVDEKTVEVGEQVSPGEQMMVISQIDDVWITANFKETEIQKMRPGQHVDIHVDALGETLHGYVESMPGATGSVMSLLPPENATGNFVKVVQRLPVRIRLNAGQDPHHRLRLGMSVEPKVWIR
jgi:membrane fusion protein, multidrug efflux system